MTFIEKDNIKIDKTENKVLITINPKIFNLDVIYSAAYIFLDKAYIMIDGNPEKEIVVQIKPKMNEDSETLGREFNNELLNYSVYKKQVERNSAIRQTIVQRALLTNISKNEEKENEEPEEGDYVFDDPEGIAIPWEEKYGKIKKDNKLKDSVKQEENAEGIKVPWEELEKESVQSRPKKKK